MSLSESSLSEVQDPIEREIATDLYTAEDLGRWRQGAEKFRLFWETVGQKPDRHSKRARYDEVGTLQALFLGERAMTGDCDIAEDHEDVLSKLGIASRRSLSYRPELVESLIAQHPQEFIELIDPSAPDRVERLMEKMEENKFYGSPQQSGLLLGFPREAVDFFVRRRDDIPLPDYYDELHQRLLHGGGHLALEEYIDEMKDPEEQTIAFKKLCQLLGLPVPVEAHDSIKYDYQTRGQIASIYGVIWCNPQHPSAQTLRHEKRLRAAFERSGILNVFDPQSIVRLKRSQLNEVFIAAEREIRDRLKALLE